MDPHNHALVSCPRSSSPLAADFWDQHATENKELMSRLLGSPPAANLRVGTLDARNS
jgi:hypothetical protein